MNKPTEVIEHESQELVEIQSAKASTLALITDEATMQRVMALAETMAESKVTVPKHLQGNKGDCAAIIIQSAQWGLNHWAVAQKTHLVNGVLGYEAQLVNAVLQATRSIKGSFHYEYQGDGNTLQCRVGAILAGDNEITWGEWLKSADVTTKNSPLWKVNPKQQMGYLQTKNFARLYCPGAILGVYTPDEIEVMGDREIEINPLHKTGNNQAQAALAPVDEANQERKGLIEMLEGVAKKEGLMGYGEAWMQLTREQRNLVGDEEHQRIKALATNGAGDSADAENNGPTVTGTPPAGEDE